MTDAAIRDFAAVILVSKQPERLARIPRLGPLLQSVVSTGVSTSEYPRPSTASSASGHQPSA